jgi:hypothetical protein
MYAAPRTASCIALDTSTTQGLSVPWTRACKASGTHARQTPKKITRIIVLLTKALAQVAAAYKHWTTFYEYEPSTDKPTRLSRMRLNFNYSAKRQDIPVRSDAGPGSPDPSGSSVAAGLGGLHWRCHGASCTANIRLKRHPYYENDVCMPYENRLIRLAINWCVQYSNVCLQAADAPQPEAPQAPQV